MYFHLLVLTLAMGTLLIMGLWPLALLSTVVGIAIGVMLEVRRERDEE